MVLSSWQGHCESSPSSFDECRPFDFLPTLAMNLCIVSGHTTKTFIFSLTPSHQVFLGFPLCVTPSLYYISCYQCHIYIQHVQTIRVQLL